MKQTMLSIISSMIDRVMNKVLAEDPLSIEGFHTQRRVYSALVPNVIFKGSYFEQSFISVFSEALRDLAAVAARESIGHCETKKTVFGVIRRNRLVRISEVLNRFEHQTQSKEQRHWPDWDAELAYILEGKGEKISTKVIVDVYAENSETGERLAFELKAPLPNSDITKVSKEKLFKLYYIEPSMIDHAYYALPYNPYNKRENYN